MHIFSHIVVPQISSMPMLPNKPPQPSARFSQIPCLLVHLISVIQSLGISDKPSPDATVVKLSILSFEQTPKSPFPGVFHPVHVCFLITQFWLSSIQLAWTLMTKTVSWILDWYLLQQELATGELSCCYFNQPCAQRPTEMAGYHHFPRQNVSVAGEHGCPHRYTAAGYYQQSGGGVACRAQSEPLCGGCSTDFSRLSIATPPLYCS